MKYSWIDAVLLQKPGVTKDLQAEWNWIRYHIGGKMFAAVCLDDATGKPVYITCKLDPAEGDFLRRQYEDIIPGYKLIRAAVMANNLTNVNRRLMWLDEADAEKTLLLVLLGVAKNQKYITQKKLLELQGKLEEIGRIIGGLQKFFINNRK